MTKPITIAIDQLSGKFILADSIDPSDKETRRNCYCLKCGMKLEPVLEFKDAGRTKFFRHNTNPTCEGAHETALHELAKQILLENLNIETEEHGLISYSGSVAEKQLEQRRPDVSATHDGKPIYFEVYVSHAVDSGKEKFFKLGKHRSIEIDLSNCTSTSGVEIK